MTKYSTRMQLIEKSMTTEQTGTSRRDEREGHTEVKPDDDPGHPISSLSLPSSSSSFPLTHVSDITTLGSDQSGVRSAIVAFGFHCVLFCAGLKQGLSYINVSRIYYDDQPSKSVICRRRPYLPTKSMTDSQGRSKILPRTFVYA